MDTAGINTDVSPWTIVDISSEAYREYRYEEDRKFTIFRPETLYILANGSHRVVDKAGVTHRPERNFVGISWKPRDGQPPFVA